jgi:hypothetical protein
VSAPAQLPLLHAPIIGLVPYTLDYANGWEKIREDCGSSGGGAWTKPRAIGDAALGGKTLWVWRYAA